MKISALFVIKQRAMHEALGQLFKTVSWNLSTKCGVLVSLLCCSISNVHSEVEGPSCWAPQALQGSELLEGREEKGVGFPSPMMDDLHFFTYLAP